MSEQYFEEYIKRDYVFIACEEDSAKGFGAAHQ